jgi:hypothetical protein
MGCVESYSKSSMVTGVGVARNISNLELPYDVNLLKKFGATLLAAYNFKHYLMQANSSLVDALSFVSAPSSPLPSTTSATSSASTTTFAISSDSTSAATTTNTSATPLERQDYLRKHSHDELEMPHTLSSPKRILNNSN